MSTVIAPARVERAAFSAFTAPSTILRNWASTLASSSLLSERMSTSSQMASGIEFTDVPPPTTLVAYVVLGLAGVTILFISTTVVPMAAMGFTRP